MSNIIINGAKDDGNGLIELTVDDGGGLHAPVDPDSQDVIPAPTPTSLPPKTVIYGGIVFDTSGSGSAQTFRAGALSFVPCSVNPTIHGSSPVGAIRLPAGTLKNLRVSLDQGPWSQLSSQHYDVTLYVNGSPAALVVSGTTADGEDTTHTVVITADDPVNIKITTTVTDGDSSPVSGVTIGVSCELVLS